MVKAGSKLPGKSFGQLYDQGYLWDSDLIDGFDSSYVYKPDANNGSKDLFLNSKLDPTKNTQTVFCVS